MTAGGKNLGAVCGFSLSVWRFTAFILVVSALIATLGCRSSPPENLPEPQALTGDSDEPAWVTRPWSVSSEGTKGTVLYAVGYAQENPDLSIQMEIARARGRNELARIMKLLVTAVTEDLRRTGQQFGGKQPGEADQFSVVFSEQVAHKLLAGSKQVDGWLDRDNGYWVLMKVPFSKTVSENSEEVLKSLEKNEAGKEGLKRVRSLAKMILHDLASKEAEGIRQAIQRAELPEHKPGSRPQAARPN